VKKFKVSVDRLEEEKAVLLAKGIEDEIIFPRLLLPSDIKEGDILSFSMEVSAKETERTKEKVKELLEKLKRKKI
jgi:hypothetical protein